MGNSAVLVTAQDTQVTNHGGIYAFTQTFSPAGIGVEVTSSGAGASILNTGIISASANAVFAGAAARVVNSGTLSSNEGTVLLQAGSINNSGTIQSASSSAINLLGAATVLNDGTLLGATGIVLNFGGTLFNGGLIQAPSFAVNAQGSATVNNAGRIEGLVSLSNFADSLRNTGTLLGNVNLNDGADIFDSRAGIHIGAVFGSDGNDVLIGGSGTSELLGENGDDLLFAINTITTTGGILRGGAGNDELNGAAGDDLLDPGTGSDIVRGGAATDWIVYASAASAVTVDLDDNAQNTGEASDDTIDEVEVVQGSLFSDTLRGSSAINSLQGLAGNDTLDGRAGADFLRGGIGNDTYVVDNARERVIEWADQGADTVLASTSFRLLPQVSVELLATTSATGTTAINLTGNAGAQTITGNDGANALQGLDGSDTLLGRAGNDILDGGIGDDFLTGGSAPDAFVLGVNGGIDTITDFNIFDDTIRIASARVGLPAGAISSAAFRLGPAALDADDRLLYNQATGSISIDLNGNAAGSPFQIATLSSRPTGLTSADFLLI